MTFAEHLGLLEAAGLIRPVADLTDPEYLFRHALVQDAAYDSLLKADRKWLHRAVGEVLEGLYPDRREELAPMLARHFAEAGDAPRAFRYYRLAGDIAWHRYANAEAVTHYSQALDLAAMVGAASATRIHLWRRRGRALELQGQWAAALAGYQAMAAGARAEDDLALELAALMAAAAAHATPSEVHDRQAGEALCDQALALARTLGDRAAEARILWLRLLLAKLAGPAEMAAAIPYGEQSLALARELGLHEQMAQTLNDLSYCYSNTGQEDRARATGAEARTLWRELGNLPLLADNLTNAALGAVGAGEYEQALDLAQEAYTVSTTIANAWGQAYSLMAFAQAYYERGEYQAARAAAEDAVPLGAQAGFRLAELICLGYQANVCLAAGQFAQAMALTDRTVAAADQFAGWEIWTRLRLARCQLLTGDRPAAERTVAEVRARNPAVQTFDSLALIEAEIARAAGDYSRTLALLDGILDRAGRPPDPVTLVLIAAPRVQALAALDRLDEARAVGEEARAFAAARGQRRLLWPILDLLSRLAGECGDATTAAARHAEAQAVITFIAEHAAPDQREAFLARPDVRPLLAALETP